MVLDNIWGILSTMDSNGQRSAAHASVMPFLFFSTNAITTPGGGVGEGWRPQQLGWGTKKDWALSNFEDNIEGEHHFLHISHTMSSYLLPFQMNVCITTQLSFRCNRISGTFKWVRPSVHLSEDTFWDFTRGPKFGRGKRELGPNFFDLKLQREASTSIKAFIFFIQSVIQACERHLKGEIN